MTAGHFTHNIINIIFLCFKQPKEPSSIKSHPQPQASIHPTFFLNKFLCLADNLGQKFT